MRSAVCPEFCVVTSCVPTGGESGGGEVGAMDVEVGPSNSLVAISGPKRVNSYGPIRIRLAEHALLTEDGEADIQSVFSSFEASCESFSEGLAKRRA